MKMRDRFNFIFKLTNLRNTTWLANEPKSDINQIKIKNIN